MRIDIHVHIFGLPGESNRLPASRDPLSRWLFRIFMRKYGFVAEDLLCPHRAAALREKVLSWIDASGLDRVVLLALDDTHDETGRAVPGIPASCIDNDAAAKLAESHPRVLLGASVHPYRKDALRELERWAARGACLIKWLPSVQNIDPEDKRCIPFYEALADMRLPLLCHTGHEHTLRGRDGRFNHPAKLVPALSRGVTVIAAHCGKRMLLHESCFFAEWKRMALKHERLYGDLGAFLVPTRLSALGEIKGDPALAAKILYGSDFPMVPWTPGLTFWVGREAAAYLQTVKNPFARPREILRSLGFPEAVFSRAAQLLRMSPDPKASLPSPAQESIP